MTWKLYAIVSAGRVRRDVSDVVAADRCSRADQRVCRGARAGSRRSAAGSRTSSALRATVCTCASSGRGRYRTPGRDPFRFGSQSPRDRRRQSRAARPSLETRAGSGRRRAAARSRLSGIASDVGGRSATADRGPRARRTASLIVREGRVRRRTLHASIAIDEDVGRRSTATGATALRRSALTTLRRAETASRPARSAPRGSPSRFAVRPAPHSGIGVGLVDGHDADRRGRRRGPARSSRC